MRMFHVVHWTMELFLQLNLDCWLLRKVMLLIHAHARVLELVLTVRTFMLGYIFGVFMVTFDRVDRALDLNKFDLRG